MDFKKCFDILASRACSQDEVCSCCKKTQPTVATAKESDPDNVNHEKTLPPEHNVESDNSKALVSNLHQESSIIHLIGLIIDIQAARLKTYKQYDQELGSIIATTDLSRYPALCANNTAMFASLSREVMNIKEEISSRKIYNSLVSIIEKIQMAEKEKLMLVAAHQLERMKFLLPELRDVVGDDCDVQKSYISKKLNDFEETIAELVEELMCYRIELLENDDTLA